MESKRLASLPRAWVAMRTKVGFRHRVPLHRADLWGLGLMWPFTLIPMWLDLESPLIHTLAVSVGVFPESINKEWKTFCVQVAPQTRLPWLQRTKQAECKHSPQCSCWCNVIICLTFPWLCLLLCNGSHPVKLRANLDTISLKLLLVSVMTPVKKKLMCLAISYSKV